MCAYMCVFMSRIRLEERLILAHLCFLQAGAEANLPNNVGDTALHKAAFTGRKVRITGILYFQALRL